MRAPSSEEPAPSTGAATAPGAVVFDLDGTVADSQEGILVCLHDTLRDFGRRADDAFLRTLIGPPLDESFRELGFTGDELVEAMDHYRVLYGERGVALARPYDGIVATLTALHGDGVRLILATAKRLDFAERMLDDFGVRGLFDVVAGASPDNSLTSKIDIVASVRSSFDARPGATWMVGDRRHDVEAARALGLYPVGVLWGYGSREELVDAGARWLVSRPVELLVGFDEGPRGDTP